MDFFKIAFLLSFTIMLVGSCSFDKENLKTPLSDKKNNLYPVGCDYSYTGIDSGKNNYTRRCH